MKRSKGKKLNKNKRGEDFLVSIVKRTPLYLLFYLIVVFFLYFLVFGLIGGARFYEFLLIMSSVAIMLALYYLWKNEKIEFKQKFKLSLTLLVLLFTIAQPWATLYPHLPRIYTPGVDCPNSIELTEEGRGEFSFKYGNYGDIPAWIYAKFENTTSNLSITSDEVIEMVLLPIKYENNEQHTYSFKFEVNNSAEKIGFKLKHIVYGDDIINYWFAKLISKPIVEYVEPPKTCEYEKINDTMYSKVTE